MIDERLAAALETIGGALASIAKTMELEYQRKLPVSKKPSEPTVTHVKTEEELIRESLGETGEQTTEDWLSLGPRERAFVEKERAFKK